MSCDYFISFRKFSNLCKRIFQEKIWTTFCFGKILISLELFIKDYHSCIDMLTGKRIEILTIFPGIPITNNEFHDEVTEQLQHHLQVSYSSYYHRDAIDSVRDRILL